MSIIVYSTDPARTQARREHKQYIKRWYLNIKFHSQCKCGETDPDLLTFHHRDPHSKKWNISCMVVQGKTKTKILEEMAKCDILCKRCHKRLHGNI